MPVNCCWRGPMQRFYGLKQPWALRWSEPKRRKLQSTCYDVFQWFMQLHHWKWSIRMWRSPGLECAYYTIRILIWCKSSWHRSVKHDHSSFIHVAIRFYATCTVLIPIATESWLFGATEVAFAHFYARHLKLPGRKLSNEARKPSKANSFQQRPSTGSQPEAVLLKPELKHSQPSWPPPKWNLGK